jgi:hypothetical protein
MVLLHRCQMGIYSIALHVQPGTGHQLLSIACCMHHMQVLRQRWRCSSAVTQLLAAARAQLGEILSAFEFLDGLSMQLVCSHAPGVSNPLVQNQASAAGADGNQPPVSPFYVLVETHGSNAEHDTDKLQRFLEVGVGCSACTAACASYREQQ